MGSLEKEVEELSKKDRKKRETGHRKKKIGSMSCGQASYCGIEFQIYQQRIW